MLASRAVAMRSVDAPVPVPPRPDKSSPGECPDENTLVEMLEGQLSSAARDEIHAHLDRCRSCRTMLVELAPIAAAPEPTSSTDAGPGRERMGRYEIRDVLGRGGMGVVYEAFDPDLDRRVALKVLHTVGDRAQDRILREARAMARLSHPNVVQVHETGRYEGGWYIAMELVAGATLSDWAVGRPWRERLEACLQAGAGLSAAHAAGLVHRDFKPSNVLCGSDGRARVTDFGLVGASGSAEVSVAGDGSSDGATSLTRSGSVLGTPAFMPPEQRQGRTVDARSDQFAYCRTVWRLLAARPQAGLHDETPSATTAWPADAPRVPPRVLAVLRRGLAASPDDRWPSMDALRVALARAVARRWWRWLWLIPAAAALAGLWVVQQRRQLTRQQQRCERWANSIDSVYGPSTQAELDAVIRATEAPYAEAATGQVRALLTAKAEAWRGQAQQACIAHNVAGTLPPAHAGRAEWCLLEHRLALSVTIDALRGVSPRSADKAVLLAAEPFTVAACTDPVALPRLSAPPPDADRRQLRLARRALLQTEALIREAKVADALAAARAAQWHAARAGTPAMGLESRARQAKLLSQLGDPAAAEATGIATYMEAMKLGAWNEAFVAATALAEVVGANGMRHDDGLLWVDLADAALAHAADPLGLHRARALIARGSIELEAGQTADGLGHHREAAEIRARVLGAQHLLTLRTQINVATALTMRSRVQDARTLLLDSREGLVATLGDAHPTVASTDATIAHTFVEAGEPDTALPWLQGAVAVLRRQSDPDARALGRLVQNLGLVRLKQGDFAGAKRDLQEALAIREAVLPATHPDIAANVGYLGTVARLSGDHARAAALFERAIGVSQAQLGPDHRQVGILFQNLGELYTADGPPERATAAYREALRIESREANPVSMAYVRVGLGTAAYKAGRYREAIDEFAQALNLRRSVGIEGPELAFAEFLLAAALWEAAPEDGRDRRRAEALARAALNRVPDDTGPANSVRAQVQAWLTANGLGAAADP